MALGTMAILGLATAAGGVAQGMAASKASKAQQQAASDANETQRYIFDQQVGLTETQRGIGNNALAALAFESGVGPRPSASSAMTMQTINDAPVYEREAIIAQGGRGEGETLGYQDVLRSGGGTQYRVGDQTFDDRTEAEKYLNQQNVGAFDYTPINMPDPNLDLSTSAFEASPGYQFRVDEGNKALERTAAARGLRLSGGALKDAMRFGQGIGSQEYGNFVGRTTDQFNRSYGVGMDKMNALRGLAGTGQQATQAQINAGSNYATAYGQNARAGGAAAAQGAIGVGNAITGGINSLSGLYGQAQSGYLGQNPGFGIKPVFDPFKGAS